MEQTFVMIKPDGIKLGLVGEIIRRFEKKQLKLIRSELRKLTISEASEHYKELADKPFYDELVAFITSGDVMAMVWEGPQAVRVARNLIGATNPVESLPGTIRGDYALEISANIIHGSDSLKGAKREIEMYFPELLNREFQDIESQDILQTKVV